MVIKDFNIPLSMDNSSRQNNQYRNTGLNTLDHMDVTDTLRIFHLKAEYTFFSSGHRIFSRINPVRPKTKSQ